ncbi:PREDICTED: protein phosphatase 1L isoform X3 [Rhagoletis zephyria]|uniref:protein phosphatase 1L isoform X2 n=1 Tax=Rhagoletis zephyria TaxID=28612 RepID=UPI00081199F0|nr:PREDICTED: protein phosphatase 1L isoform X2 [Rhagoletis zephyria]XP_017481754.1 PREDICTED: protein phosphatase 1L isoform X3 [Rhagoletis zephyria]
MDDELEDKVFYQAYVSHMKILSKFAVGFSSINSPLAYIWKLCRLYVLRPEVIFFGVILFIFLIYLQAVDAWSRGILGRIQTTLGRQRTNRMKMTSEASGHGDYQSWEEVRQQSAVYALLGRRPRMEDRYIIEENINNDTGISLFAIFDGHGGEFAVDFAKDILVKNIYNKIIATTKLLGNQQHLSSNNNNAATDADYVDYDASPYLKRRASRKDDSNKENNEPSVRRRDSLRKAHSTADDCKASSGGKKPKDTDVFTSKLNSLMRGSNAAKDALFGGGSGKDAGSDGGKKNGPPQNFDAKCYIENGKINYGKLITDEVLAADYKLVEAAKKTTNIAGTTALIAVIEGTKLTVANVGDSRGVMCDARGIAIPLSFDHKPQQVRERKRIHDAGGFIAFRGVWRVAGILATSRALGDYPLKDKNLVIANPDILTFELNDHKPAFLILASDGLWDTFNNEEACTFIKKHLHEADYGAKALTMESYQRGSVDNITVLLVVFRNGNYRISSATTSTNGNGDGSSASASKTANNATATNKFPTANNAAKFPVTNLIRSNSGVGTK